MVKEFNDKDWKYKLTKLELHQEVSEIYLEATYEAECKREKGILHIPKIPLYIADIPKINVYEDCDLMRYGIGRRLCEVDLGFGNIQLKDTSKNEHWFTYKRTEEKIEELTLEDIEQKLGYKVKIVSKE